MAESPNEQLVRALDDRERLAALHRDIAALEELWSEEFAVNAPNNEIVVGRRAVLDTFVHSGIIDFATFERETEHVAAHGDFVILMGVETLTPKRDAPAAGLAAGRTIERRFTNVWRNENGTWRLYARHANVIPNP